MHENRSSERRRLTPRLAALLLTLVAALAALLLGSVGEAQGTAGALVSNIGQAKAGDTLLRFTDLAQAFTTGDSDTGYTLTSIELSLVTHNVSNNSAPPTVTLHSGSANGTKVADFTGPSLEAFTTKNYTFTPTGTVTLNASTEYFVVAVGGDPPSPSSWADTTHDTEDAGAESGWSIADVG